MLYIMIYSLLFIHLTIEMSPKWQQHNIKIETEFITFFLGFPSIGNHLSGCLSRFVYPPQSTYFSLYNLNVIYSGDPL